ncbi:glycosyltransferase family 2 protein [Flavobacterium hungaricum]|uniref:Glycosyltransferase n=1 Tax=Flavobacterium hungaricum TaxID=2082725 RepID=A0ABR9TQY1_9FLAO|nr:galactosyltransferase-related protein [Flavobacterium hungaricum]MBE8727781.1 glycosyltransferase [Flavobacterium hungaricum]
MLTVVLTNRNRDLHIVKNCLQSLIQQNYDDFCCFLVDYGSELNYLEKLNELLLEFPKIKFISCPVQHQLWNKSRAINIALKQCQTPFFFVADIDMIFNNGFIQKLYDIKQEREAVYFQVGFLDEKESQRNCNFEDYQISFNSNKEATGMTLYPTDLLKQINGFDEFYHGWGAEDTDTHVRLQNLGININYYDSEVLVLHQWHPKQYRSINSTDAYHSGLEKINHSYLKIGQQTNQTIANKKQQWGLFPKNDLYQKLKRDFDFSFDILPEINQLTAFIAQLANFHNKTLSVTIKDVDEKTKSKEVVKKYLGKKYINFLKMDFVNDLILQEIIFHYRNVPYEYSFDKKNRIIELKIYLTE